MQLFPYIFGRDQVRSGIVSSSSNSILQLVGLDVGKFQDAVETLCNTRDLLRIVS